MTTDHTVKIIGSIAKSLIASIRYDELHKNVFETYAPGLLDMDDSDWYPVANVKNALEKLVAMRDSLISTFDMMAIGMEAAQRAPIPEGVTLEQFLIGQQATIEQIYQGENKGYGKAEKIDHNHYRIEVDLPWHSDLMYGNYYGFAKRLLPEGSTVTLRKAEDQQEDQRPLVFYIQWS